MMPKLIVGFSQNKMPLSWFIRKMSRSGASHTYIRIPIPEMNTSVIYQAQGFNVHYIQYDRFLEHGNKVVAEVEVELTDEQWAEAEKVRVYECGKTYSYSQLIGYAWVLLGRGLGKKWSNPLADGKHGYVCVELVCRCLGIGDAESMTPQDLLEHLSDKHGSI